MKSGDDVFSKLRKQYPKFIFESVSYTKTEKELSGTFLFKAGRETFTPCFSIPMRPFFSQRPHRSLDLEKLIFNIGMVELVSYWKAMCSPTVNIMPFALSQTQKNFWKKLYFNGLGEFFYTNGITTDLQSFMTMEANNENPTQRTDIPFPTQGVIVPIGGGKDSVVTLEILKNHRTNVIPLIINPRGATLDTLKTAGFKEEDAIIIYRTIDRRLLELNTAGFLNGHTPFSALLASYSVLASYLTGVQNVALSNEASADEATVHNSSVNHQYSKSLEFENDFRKYTKKFVLKNHEYFSFLRPLSELTIASLFAEYPRYYSVFKSCNVGSKKDIWCQTCPKCLFAYIILSPFIEEKILSKNIFSENLLDNDSLKNIFMELIGETPSKPFECVGTVQEVNEALSMLYNQMRGKKMPALLKEWSLMRKKQTQLKIESLQYTKKRLTKKNLQPEYYNILQRQVQYPHAIRLTGEWEGRNIMILGWGKEGQSTYKFFRQRFSQMPICVSDEKESTKQDEIFKTDPYVVFYTWNEAFEHINETDIIIKSPGIPFEKLHHRVKDLTKITSQTEIFLRYFSRQTIGITGTKGKTTTTKLLGEILLKAGIDTIVAGNGGVPVFDIWNQITPATKVVLELSSHQLEKITIAPAWSALLNIYEEHLDHYKSYRDYQQAKLNIATRQTAEDTFLYFADDAVAAEWISEIKFKQTVLPMDLSTYHWDHPRYLYGNHNLRNVLCAATMAECLGVSTPTINKVLSTFHTAPHRLEPIGTFHNIDFFDDSISTIPEATIAAVKALPDVETLILGGFDRGIHYNKLIDFLLQSKIKNIAFMGKAGRRMQSLLPEKHHFNVLMQDRMEEIVAWCFQNTKAGKGCLLSPAASSYDRYKNFEHRGNTFRETVKQCEKTSQKAQE